MQNKIAIFFIVLVISFSGCSKPTEENITEFKYGQYKADIRSQAFHHSAIRNVDICVAEADSKSFPSDKSQCFLHGFDFSGLSIGWTSDRDIEINFDCGRVTSFTNFALITNKGAVPIEFHAYLNERCDRSRTDAQHL